MTLREYIQLESLIATVEQKRKGAKGQGEDRWAEEKAAFESLLTAVKGMVGYTKMPGGAA